MDRERAESYVLYHMRGSNMYMKKCAALLPLNIILLVVALILYHETIFLSLVIVFALLNIVLVIITSYKWSVRLGFVSRSILWIYFIIAFDCVYFAMYKRANLFVLYEYLIAIVVQIFCYILSAGICIIIAKRHDKENKYPSNNAKIAASLAGLCCAGTAVFCKIFLTDASLSLVLIIISTVINFIIYLSSYVSVTAFYCAHIIRKFDLKLNEENMNDSINIQ